RDTAACRPERELADEIPRDQARAREISLQHCDAHQRRRGPTRYRSAQPIATIRGGPSERPTQTSRSSITDLYKLTRRSQAAGSERKTHLTGYVIEERGTSRSDGQRNRNSD